MHIIIFTLCFRPSGELLDQADAALHSGNPGLAGVMFLALVDRHRHESKVTFVGYIYYLRIPYLFHLLNAKMEQ